MSSRRYDDEDYAPYWNLTGHPDLPADADEGELETFAREMRMQEQTVNAAADRTLYQEILASQDCVEVEKDLLREMLTHKGLKNVLEPIYELLAEESQKDQSDIWKHCASIFDRALDEVYYALKDHPGGTDRIESRGYPERW